MDTKMVFLFMGGYLLIGVISSLILIGVQRILNLLGIDSWWFIATDNVEVLGINIFYWPVSFYLAMCALLIAMLMGAIKFSGCLIRATVFCGHHKKIIPKAKEYFNEPDNGMSIFGP